MSRHLNWLLIPPAILTILWMAIPTERFVRPLDLTYDTASQEFTFTRIVWGASVFGQTEGGSSVIPGQWASEIGLLDGTGRECSSQFWRTADYQQSLTNVVRYTLEGWAEPCLRIGPPFVVRTRRSVSLWGWLPLRPSHSTFTVLEVDPNEIRGVKQ